MSQDFSLLYFQLGLEPGCSLDDLKRAYRVRVAELHPDRHNDAAASGEGHEALTELTALYSKAIRFHRIHGRLPGAAPKSTGTHSLHVPQPPPVSRSSHESVPASTRADWSASRAAASSNASNRSTPTLAIVTILVLVVVMIVLHWSETSFEQKVEEGLHAQEAAEPGYDSQQPRLVLGMEEGAVFAIQGAPVVVQDDIWNYGSSWVRFEDGHLVDWSSAPPNRLSTATPRPVTEEEEQEQTQ